MKYVRTIKRPLLGMDDLTAFLKRSGISGEASQADLSRPSSHKVTGRLGSSSGEKGGFSFAGEKGGFSFASGQNVQHVLGDTHMSTKQPKSKAKRGGTDLTHLTTEAELGSEYWAKPASTSSSSSFSFSIPAGKGFTYRGSAPSAATVKAATDFVKSHNDDKDDDLSDL